MPWVQLVHWGSVLCGPRTLQLSVHCVLRERETEMTPDASTRR